MNMKGWLTGKNKNQQAEKPQSQGYGSSYLNPVKAIAALTKGGQAKPQEKDQKAPVESSPTKEVRSDLVAEPDVSSDDETNQRKS